MPANTIHSKDFNETITWLHNQLTGHWVVGTPLGIGKPNPLINALYDHAVAQPDVSLEIFTALSLEIPTGDSLLERRFLSSFTQRFFGEYPELKYISAVKNNSLPANITVREFYMQSGKMLRSNTAQRNYVSSNYTHVARDMVDREVNVILQMVAVNRNDQGNTYSLSCNPDLTLDLIRIAEEKGQPRPKVIAMVNEALPFMGGQAEVAADFFDVIHDDKAYFFEPFATPAQAINVTDYSIGLLASILLKDGGTLQIGIGSLADALVYCSQMRHQNNDTYRQLLVDSGVDSKFKDMIESVGDVKPFEQGLYAASEMFVEGFAHLFDAGILQRKVYPDAEIQQLINQGELTEKLDANILELLLKHGVIDARITARQFARLQKIGILNNGLTFEQGVITDSSGQKFPADLHDENNLAAISKHCVGSQLKQGAVLHAAFFMGSKRFYAWLKNLSDEKRSKFQMTPVSQINELYGGEALDRVQRVKARFINTCMKVDLMGAAASDALDNHQVVSGVGGQYNFVAMAHALSDSRSILMLRSVHAGKHAIESNIVWKYGYCTIPRHLRDVVITEYGIADLRGQSDEVCAQRMICIADSRFQEGLRLQAVAYNKLSADWQVPEIFLHNTPDKIQAQFTEVSKQGYFPQYPFGEDFTEQEKVIIKALKWLKVNTGNKYATLMTIAKASWAKPSASQLPYLQMMQLDQSSGFREKLSAKLFIHALKHCGV
ncbi:Acetyl-CoA hydrolase [hydrothermal vent metagenome]|uniref:Acetyl-CoA hydrolase n=1 Tax=hydrothermal vent metagenome TaxID=652676 RepID=A0A3B0W547_9ZZZZ